MIPPHLFELCKDVAKERTLFRSILDPGRIRNQGAPHGRTTVENQSWLSRGHKSAW